MKTIIEWMNEAGIDKTQMRLTKDGRYYVQAPTTTQVDTATKSDTMVTKSDGTVFDVRCNLAGSEFTDKFGRTKQRATNSINLNPANLCTDNDF